VLRAMEGTAPLPRWDGAADPQATPGRDEGDFAEVRGQTQARRAVEIAVAGGHNVLLYGPPGIGKTMIARRLPSILPRLGHDEAIEVTRVYSAAGLLPHAGLVSRRPFRAPHHTVSAPALVGGGPLPRPGEISLAHRGVLFLDELPEFSRAAIEALRQPLEDRWVRIGRVGGTACFPAGFLLAASANPCPCGWHGSSERECTCSLAALERYRARVSGPILDRIDIQVRVGSVALAEMRAEADGESSAAMRARVEAARARQAARQGGAVNAELGPDATRASCRLTAAAERALDRLCQDRGRLTARGMVRVIRVARTICDLEGEDRIDAGAVMEASMYRALDTDPLTDPRALRAAAQPKEGETHVQDS
jgi:magnesium chelatase family protein